MAGTVVDAAGQFNRRTPGAVKARNHFLMREMRTQDSAKKYMSNKASHRLATLFIRASRTIWV